MKHLNKFNIVSRETYSEEAVKETEETNNILFFTVCYDISLGKGGREGGRSENWNDPLIYCSLVTRAQNEPKRKKGRKTDENYFKFWKASKLLSVMT